MASIHSLFNWDTDPLAKNKARNQYDRHAKTSNDKASHESFFSFLLQASSVPQINECRDKTASGTRTKQQEKEILKKAPCIA